MVIKVSIQGSEETQNYIINLPKKLLREINQVSYEFASMVQKSAKLRAPKASGQLAESIIIKRNEKEVIIKLNSPYAIYQEEGFRPHWIHKDQYSRSGYRFSDWLSAKGYTGTRKYFLVKQYKPFLIPALEVNLSNLPNLLSKAVKKGVK